MNDEEYNKWCLFAELMGVDFIVEQGTSGIWTYRKWNSGIAECWGREENMTITSGYVTLSPFPSNLFINDEPNTTNITPWYGASSSRVPKILFLTGTLGRVVYLRTYSNGVPTGNWSCFAEYKGRWK